MSGFGITHQWLMISLSFQTIYAPLCSMVGSLTTKLNGCFPQSEAAREIVRCSALLGAFVLQIIAQFIKANCRQKQYKHD